MHLVLLLGFNLSLFLNAIFALLFGALTVLFGYLTYRSSLTKDSRYKRAEAKVEGSLKNFWLKNQLGLYFIFTIASGLVSTTLLISAING